MATSKIISSEPKAVLVPNELFTWDSGNLIFAVPIATIKSNTGLSDIVRFNIQGGDNSTGFLFGVGISGDGKRATICGYIPSSNQQISSNDINRFKLYAIGY